MLEKLSKLIDVRTIVTFAITGTVVFLGVTGKLSPEDIKEIALVIVTFFFVKEADKALKT